MTAAHPDDSVDPASAPECAPARTHPRSPRSRLRGAAATAGLAVAPAGCDLDEIDLRLLRILQVDGRISNLKLAAAVGLSSASTHDRVHRLLREGVIVGFNARLNPGLLDAGMLVFAEVRLAETSVEASSAFKAAVRQRPEILECHEVAGGFDYLLKTRVSHMHAYRDLVAAVAWQLPGVRDVRTYAVMEELKNTSAVPV